LISLDDFGKEVLVYLSAHVRELSGTDQGGGGDEEGTIELIPAPTVDGPRKAAATEWQRNKFDAGYGWIDGPVEYGGRGLTSEHAALFRSLEARFDTPGILHLGIGLGMVAPTILRFGGPETKRRWLRAMYRGDAVGCQLFSEPTAGSDLASLRTTAVRDGDGWVVNGQKVWSSEAHHADVGLLLARTGPDQRHHGLTCFALDMRAPGVDVRPLRQSTGDASFNEVFFDDVPIPDVDRLGDVNEGWSVARAVLAGERDHIGRVPPGLKYVLNGRMRQMVATAGRNDDPVVRQRLVDVEARAMMLGWMAARDVPGPALKLYTTDTLLRMAEVASAALGARMVIDTGEWGTYTWGRFELSIPGIRFGGGTDQVQRNVIGEQILGLPREPRPPSRLGGLDPA
jgi:alkylation response protein AidB-like acyl-CoA dehydrogenase